MTAKNAKKCLILALCPSSLQERAERCIVRISSVDSSDEERIHLPSVPPPPPQFYCFPPPPPPPPPRPLLLLPSPPPPQFYCFPSSPSTIFLFSLLLLLNSIVFPPSPTRNAKFYKMVLARSR